MVKQIELKLSPEDAANESLIREIAAKKCQVKENAINEIVKLKRSIDARDEQPKIVLLLDIYLNEIPVAEPSISGSLKKLSTAPVVIIVGAGPAGYFAALELIELGIKPVIFERGKDVQERRKDLRQIQQFGVVNPHSNYCFGEGGAGTYSDGKLYTRSTKRGDVKKVLKLLVEHGAKPDILVDTHPHIGSNKLPVVVKNIRETILGLGGEINFDSWVTDLIIENEEILGVVVNDKQEHFADSVILATGHSARDIFYLLQKKNIDIEAKPFAMGVRIEHNQGLIDQIQYRQNPREDLLPASSYKLVSQVNNRGVFSFCMCPGGFIVPSATAPGELVINGMSLSKRDSEFANSGIVVGIETEDLQDYNEHGALAGLKFQEMLERKVFLAGGGITQQAPAQRMTDFVNGKVSASLAKTSYIPGITSFPVHELLPENISSRLQLAFIDFGKKMKGYYTEEANVIALESRTSSPVKIPRDKDTMMHVRIKKLYPCAEGAGYAGGIVSAAIDGQNCARAIASNLGSDG
jgi:uncharacterized FAD-dependent dehydrogenase